MTAVRAIIVLIALLNIPQIALSTPLNAYVIGTAYDIGTDNVLYQEHYSKVSESEAKLADSQKSQQPSGNIIQVDYFDNEGEQLSKKILNYTRHRFAPSLVSEDYRFKSSFKVAMLPANGSPDTVSIISQQDGHEVEDLLSLKDIDATQLVIDAGFDAFVRSHWQSLVDGRRLVINFVVSNRQSIVKLSVRSTNCDSQRQCFRIKAKNWIVAALMKPIDLEYEQDSRKLMRFTGLGQLPGNDGKSQRVDIRYKYL